jgi:hypothetical protein
MIQESWRSSLIKRVWCLVDCVAIKSNIDITFRKPIEMFCKTLQSTSDFW